MTEEPQFAIGAWQPLTPRGVAAFAPAPAWRILFAQGLTALALTAAVVWFLETHLSPLIGATLQQFPDEAAIVSGRLLNVGSRIQNGNRIFSIIADPSAEIPSDTTSDVLLRLHQHHVSVCWVGGCAQRAYSPEALVFLGRSTSDPWWGAWHPIITGALGLSVMLALWVGWGLLATVYAMLAKGIACFADRELSWPGSWRLCAAALLPGALLLGAALTAYGVGAIDLIRFIAFFFIHLVIGIFYTLAAPFFLPPLPSKTAGKNNPFENGSEKKP